MCIYEEVITILEKYITNQDYYTEHNIFLFQNWHSIVTLSSIIKFNNYTRIKYSW